MTLVGRGRVAVLITGGTIEVVGEDRLDLAWYSDSTGRASGEEVLARVPELARIADVELVAYPSRSSTEIVSGDWLSLLAALDALLDRMDVSGVVVAHGTNTLEETAYFLHLTVHSDKPVVVTGSMRPFSALSWDGEINLLDAVSVAANEQARGLGTVVVLNGAIHCAREVTKASTYQLQAFESREAGPLGYVDPDRRVRLLRCPTRRYGQDAGLDPRGSAELPRVDVAVSYVGGDGTAIDAFAAAGAKGLVFAGSGSGRGSPAEEDALARVSRRGVMVCVSSRVGAGRVVRSPRLIDLGFVAGDDLVPWKARVLLSLALTSNRRPDVVQELFDTC